MYIQSGTADTHTPVDAVANTFAWYATMLARPATDIKYQTAPSGHELPTVDSDPPFDSPGQCLGHVYDETLVSAGRVQAANLVAFDQGPYIKGFENGGWAEKGLLYLPSACRTSDCKLHVMLHDCGTREAPSLPPPAAMSPEEQAFAAYAETNRIVLLMPRLEKSEHGADAVDVNRGCWDVFAQLGEQGDYAHQNSSHLGPMLPMIEAIAGATTPRVAETRPQTIGQRTMYKPLSIGPPSPPVLPVRELPQLRIDLNKIVTNGGSSGGDLAVLFHTGFSRHVKGVCGYDAQPWRCAATKFPLDALVPQTHESSVPHCFGCPPNMTLPYDKCKCHGDFVNTTLLADAARATPICVPGGSKDCIDDPANLRDAKVFLNRGECRTYTGPAVSNTMDVYKKLGVNNVTYFDQCNPDGSQKPDDVTLMCIAIAFGPLLPPVQANPNNNFMFRQAPYVTDDNAGFGEFGYAFVPPKCANKEVACGLEVRFHGCGGPGPADMETQNYAESNNIVLLDPGVPGQNNGNNASLGCNAGTAVEGNCKEISRGCWDGYGQLSRNYHLQSAPHMQTVWKMVAHIAQIED